MHTLCRLVSTTGFALLVGVLGYLWAGTDTEIDSEAAYEIRIIRTCQHPPNLSLNEDYFRAYQSMRSFDHAWRSQSMALIKEMRGPVHLEKHEDQAETTDNEDASKPEESSDHIVRMIRVDHDNLSERSDVYVLRLEDYDGDDAAERLQQAAIDFTRDADSTMARVLRGRLEVLKKYEAMAKERVEELEQEFVKHHKTTSGAGSLSLSALNDQIASVEEDHEEVVRRLTVAKHRLTSTIGHLKELPRDSTGREELEAQLVSLRERLQVDETVSKHVLSRLEELMLLRARYPHAALAVRQIENEIDLAKTEANDLRSRCIEIPAIIEQLRLGRAVLTQISNPRRIETKTSSDATEKEIALHSPLEFAVLCGGAAWIIVVLTQILLVLSKKQPGSVI